MYWDQQFGSGFFTPVMYALKVPETVSIKNDLQQFSSRWSGRVVQDFQAELHPEMALRFNGCLLYNVYPPLRSLAVRPRKVTFPIGKDRLPTTIFQGLCSTSGARSFKVIDWEKRSMNQAMLAHTFSPATFWYHNWSIKHHVNCQKSTKTHIFGGQDAG